MTATSIFETTRSLIPVPRLSVLHRTPPSSASQLAARALGWFSIGLGALEIMAPTQLARRLGLRGKEPLLRGYGGREIAAGVAALAGFLGPAMWARVFGDLLDLATLSVSRRRDRHTARNVAIALAAVGGIALLDVCVAALISKRLHPR